MVHIENKDIFAVDSSYVLCHCISADWPRKYAGIAREFERRFAFDETLTAIYPDYKYTGGDCQVIIIQDGYTIANLITKDKYYQKPTNESIEQALSVLKQLCIKYDYKKLAMPYLIGCGMDRLKEDDVLAMIHGLFDKSNIEVLICKYKTK